jgi:hypothetical protein
LPDGQPTANTFLTVGPQENHTQENKNKKIEPQRMGIQMHIQILQNIPSIKIFQQTACLEYANIKTHFTGQY